MGERLIGFHGPRHAAKWNFNWIRCPSFGTIRSSYAFWNRTQSVKNVSTESIPVSFATPGRSFWFVLVVWCGSAPAVAFLDREGRDTWPLLGSVCFLVLSLVGGCVSYLLPDETVVLVALVSKVRFFLLHVSFLGKFLVFMQQHQLFLFVESLHKPEAPNPIRFCAF